MKILTCATPAELTDALQQLKLELSGFNDYTFTSHELDYIAAIFDGKYPIAMDSRRVPATMLGVPLSPIVFFGGHEDGSPDGYVWDLASQPSELLKTGTRELHLFL